MTASEKKLYLESRVTADVGVCRDEPLLGLCDVGAPLEQRGREPRRDVWRMRLIGECPLTPTRPVEQDENDVTSINYTSGTTARPKGVMLTHRNCYINAYNFIAHLEIHHDDVELWTLPMFHANGWGGPFGLTAMGATHVVLRAVNAEDIHRLIEEEGVTFGCMAPAVLSTILNYEKHAQHNFRTRPRFVVAGAPPPAAFIKRLEEELGWRFL
jgi:fatty-acyl-CoA synthase